MKTELGVITVDDNCKINLIYNDKYEEFNTLQQFLEQHNKSKIRHYLGISTERFRAMYDTFDSCYDRHDRVTEITYENIKIHSFEIMSGYNHVSDWAKSLNINYTDDLHTLYNIGKIFTTKYNFKTMPFKSSDITKRELTKICKGKMEEFSCIPTEFEMFSQFYATGLYGFNKVYLDMLTYADAYDFKSFYPYILYEYTFPTQAYECDPSNLPTLIKCNTQFIADITINSYSLKKNGFRYLCGDRHYNALTVTNLDLQAILENYNIDYRVNKIVVYTASKRLSEPIRDYILNQFNIKETQKTSKDYAARKKGFNAIYGLFYRYHISEYDQKHLTPYRIGAWVTSYGRYILYSILKEVKSDIITYDTDGFKVKAGTKIPTIKPYADIRLGMLVNEDSCKPIKVFGNKSYWYDNEYKVCGLDSELAKQQCNDINKIHIGYKFEKSGRYVYDKIKNTFRPTGYIIGGNRNGNAQDIH